MKVAVLAPWRPGAPDRQALWDFTRRRWQVDHPDWTIHEAPGPDGPFNRGAAINEASRAAGEWDVAVVIDCDVICSPDQVRDAVKLAAETGRCTLAYSEYRALDAAQTERVMAGADPDPKRGVNLKMAKHVSSVVVVPRPLWDQLGGFDERCEGWGHDDGIFIHTARVLGGGINERIPGYVFHLHHAYSPHRGKDDPHNLAAGALAKRYYSTHDPAETRRIIAERSQGEAFVLAVITDGRRECIGPTIEAAHRNLVGMTRARTLICDDSGDIEYAAWLRLTFPDCDLVTSNRRSGFAKAVHRAWQHALGSGQPWIFWLEDDFRITEPVDVSELAGVMDARPHLTQVMLKRQAWFPAELEVGGFVEQNPDAYEDCTDGRSHWLEHQLGHWTNPHLVRRSFLASHTWPTTNGSEARFSRQVMVGDARAAVWGKRTDPPRVEHVGERRGTGY